MEYGYDFYHMYGGGYKVYRYVLGQPRDMYNRVLIRDFATKWGARRYVKKENAKRCPIKCVPTTLRSIIHGSV